MSNKTMTEIRDAEAEKRNEAMLNVGEHWRVGHIARTNFRLGFDCRDKLDNEALKLAVEALEFYANPANFENGMIRSSDVIPAEKIFGRAIYHYTQPPERVQVFCGGRAAQAALTEIRKLRGQDV